MKIIPEQTYAASMEAEVLPVLAASGQYNYFERNGKIYYERYLCENPRASLVVVHGFTEAAEKFQEMIYYFLRDGYQVYAMDVRGHGKSHRSVDDLSLVHEEDYREYVKDVLFLAERIVRKEAPELPLYLYAHSMGGGISAAVLEVRPELFQKAVLTSPMIQPGTRGVPYALAGLIADAQIRLGNGDKYVIGFHPYQDNETFEGSPDTSPARFAYYAAKRSATRTLQTNAASYGWLKTAMELSRFVMKPSHCERIRARVLVFQAEQEDFVVNAAQERFVAQIADGRLQRMPGTKHEIYMSGDAVMEEYVERILAFFREP